VKRLLLVLLLLLSVTQPARGQIAVYDAANVIQSTITAIQTTLTVANQVLDLTPLGEIVLGDGYDEDLTQLATIAREAQGLSYDLASLNAQVTTLFDLSTAPRSTRELRQRLADIRQVVFQSYSYALRTQTLVATTLRTVQHLQRLVAAIGDFLGNNQGNQTLAQLEGTLSHTLATLQVQTAAYERAQSVERLEEALTVESLENISIEILSDWPQR
jgi:conjugal transfer/entry exclusion protein